MATTKRKRATRKKASPAKTRAKAGAAKTRAKTASKTRARAGATKSTAKKAAPAKPKAGVIQGWTTDPMGGFPPLQLPIPALPGATLATKIIAPTPAPAAGVHNPSTAQFRYWTAAEALRRTAALWVKVGVDRWQPKIGATLPVRLDDGEDLNAYYARDASPSQGIKQGLSFFHATVINPATGESLTVFSGESPDIVGHELGHAALDALKPGLFDTSTTEAGALHESFGDMSAILSALQLANVAQSVLQETGGRLSRNSSVSRVAEQLGFAIRTGSPAAVDSDSLRNASNSFIYTDPVKLPVSGPSSTLSRQAHNFSRVFTGAFLEALGNMVLVLSAKPTVEHVQQAGLDMARLLVKGIRAAPIRTRLFQSVAEQLVLADSSVSKNKYAKAITGAFVRRGILPAASLTMSAAGGQPARKAAAATMMAAVREGGGVGPGGRTTEAAAEPVRMELPGNALGIPFTSIIVQGPAVEDRPVAPAFGMAADAAPSDGRSAVAAFVEELVLRGRVAMAGQRPRTVMAMAAGARSERVTHELVTVSEGVELRRLRFNCGCCGGAHRSER